MQEEAKKGKMKAVLYLAILCLVFIALFVFDALSSIETSFDVVNGRYKHEYKLMGLEYKIGYSDRRLLRGKTFYEIVQQLNVCGEPKWLPVNFQYTGLLGRVNRVQLYDRRAKVIDSYVEFARLVDAGEIDDVTSSIVSFRKIAKQYDVHQLKQFLQNVSIRSNSDK